MLVSLFDGFLSQQIQPMELNDLTMYEIRIITGERSTYSGR